MNDLDGKYYKKLRNRWAGIMTKQLNTSKEKLLERFGARKGTKLIDEFKQEFDQLILAVPRLDSEVSSIWERQLALTAIFLSIYKVLKRYEMKPDEAWEVCMIVYGSFLKAMPKFIKKKMGKSSLSNQTINNYRKDAVQLEKRVQPKGDVFDFVEGDGKSFLFGMNIKECAKVKFLEEQDALEFMPYICLVDKIISEAMGTGLTRTKTIADGFGICDFRINDKGIVKIDSPVYKSEWDQYSKIWINIGK